MLYNFRSFPSPQTLLQSCQCTNVARTIQCRAPGLLICWDPRWDQRYCRDQDGNATHTRMDDTNMQKQLTSVAGFLMKQLKERNQYHLGHHCAWQARNFFGQVLLVSIFVYRTDSILFTQHRRTFSCTYIFIFDYICVFHVVLMPAHCCPNLP